MPLGYLATTVLIAWCAFFAVVAPRRPRRLAGMSFLFGMIINEVPHFGIYFLAASTALAAGQGDLGSTGARVTVAVAALTALALAYSFWLGTRSDRPVTHALDEGLGADWRDHVNTPLRRHRPWTRILLLPAYMAQRDVRVVRNLSYGDAGRRNLLDLYHRRDTPQNAPVLVYFHGGQYSRGAKSREARPLLQRLASQGWVCVSANYRLRPETTFPGHQIDAKKVIAWMREQGSQYGADPARLFVAGSSAGANMAGLCALTPNDPRFQPGFESSDTTVTGAICFYGFYGHYFGTPPDEPAPPMQPQGYINPDAPPFFIAHGTNDALGTVEGARHFAAELRRTSRNPVVYAELPGAQHNFDLFRSPRCEAVVDGVDAFTARTLAP